MRVRPTSATNTPLPNRFWRQWWATAVSNLGDGINFAALPLLAYSLTDDERLLSLTAFVTLVPWLVLALPVGVLVDHADRRMLMVIANVARVGLFGVIALTAGADVHHHRRVDVAPGRGRHLRGRVRQQRPGVPPDARQQRRSPTCQRLPVRGRGRDGQHPRTVGRRVPVRPRTRASVRGERRVVRSRRDPHRVDQGRTHTPPLDVNARDLGELTATIGSAFRSLWDDHLLRLLAIMLTVTNFGLMFGHGIFVKYADQELGVTGFGYGLLARRHRPRRRGRGSVRAPHDRALGTRWSIVVPYLAFGVTQVLIGAVPVTAVVAVVGFVLGGAITLWNVVTLSIRQRVIEPARFGRVNSVYRWIGTGAGAFGALVGGQLAYATDSLRVPYLAAGVITLAALAVFAAPRPTRRGRHRPHSGPRSHPGARRR